MLIRKSVDDDFPAMLAIINDAARAYRGVIPADRWHDPYMPEEDLAKEIAGGVVFWVAEQEGRVSAVIGMQDKGDVALVRHAYVASKTQRSGIGTKLLRHVQGLTDKPILIGTWSAASWAVGLLSAERVYPPADRRERAFAADLLVDTCEAGRNVSSTSRRAMDPHQRELARACLHDVLVALDIFWV